MRKLFSRNLYPPLLWSLDLSSLSTVTFPMLIVSFYLFSFPLDPQCITGFVKMKQSLYLRQMREVHYTAFKSVNKIMRTQIYWYLSVCSQSFRGAHREPTECSWYSQQDNNFWYLGYAVRGVCAVLTVYRFKHWGEANLLPSTWIHQTEALQANSAPKHNELPHWIKSQLPSAL